MTDTFFSELIELETLLKKEGFKYNSDREIYYNKKNKKIFSVEALEDHGKAWLRKCLDDSNRDWEFYFNTKPSPAVKKEIQHVLRFSA